jgi:hypothetical protein
MIAVAESARAGTVHAPPRKPRSNRRRLAGKRCAGCGGLIYTPLCVACEALAAPDCRHPDTLHDRRRGAGRSICPSDFAELARQTCGYSDESAPGCEPEIYKPPRWTAPMLYEDSLRQLMPNFQLESSW